MAAHYSEKHNVIKYDKGVYTLLAENITRKQKQMLIELCELRLQEFIDKDPAIKLAHEMDKKKHFRKYKI